MTQTSPECADCLVCGGPTTPWLTVPGDWRRPDSPRTYSLRRCPGCGFGQVDPRPDAHAIATFYELESYYTHGGPSGASSGTSRSLLDRARVKLAWHGDRGIDLTGTWFRDRVDPRARTCDLGCGDGGLIAQLAAAGHDVTGVEPDARAREVAAGKGLRVFAGTAEELPSEVADERFDCVIMSHVLEHTLDPRLAVGNAARLLTGDGLLVIETPNNEAKGLRRSGVLWPWLDVPRHLNFFTSGSLRALCEAGGLRVQDLQYCGYTRQFDRHWIETEEEVRRVFASRAGLSSGLPAGGRVANSWKLLLSTLWAPARTKYDSVRVVLRSARN